MKILLVLGALCGVALSAQSVDIRKSGSVCYWRGKEMAIDDVFTPKHDCVRAICNREGNGTSLTIQTCGTVMMAEPGWKVVRTRGVPYPDCCPKPVQVSESTNSIHLQQTKMGAPDACERDCKFG